LSENKITNSSHYRKLRHLILVVNNQKWKEKIS
jgi:hypothetical protein